MSEAKQREYERLGALIRRAVVDYRQVVDLGPLWKVRFFREGEKFDQDGQRLQAKAEGIFIRPASSWQVDGAWVYAAPSDKFHGWCASYLDELGPEGRQQLADRLAASTAIPWMKPPKDFRVVAQHHDVDGLAATLRMVPTNVCIASITGIDKATEDINPEVADRLVACWNLCSGMETDELQEMDEAKGQVAALLTALRLVSSGSLSDVESKELAAAALRSVGRKGKDAQASGDHGQVPPHNDRPRG